MPISNRLGEVLAERDISKSDLAKYIGVTRGTISNICNHKHEPSMDLAYRIAEFLNLQVTDIFYYEKDK
jgi:putative transcriptional regulator